MLFKGLKMDNRFGLKIKWFTIFLICVFYYKMSLKKWNFTIKRYENWEQKNQISFLTRELPLRQVIAYTETIHWMVFLDSYALPAFYFGHTTVKVESSWVSQ